MYAYFNELSSFPYSPSASVYAAMEGFLNSCAQLLKSGIEKIVCCDGPKMIPLSETETMHGYCVRHMHSNKVRLLITKFTKPYLQEDSDEEAAFVNAGYETKICDNEGNMISVSNPLGISAACLYNSFVVSIASSEFWMSNKVLTLRVVNGDYSFEKKIVNVSEPEDLNDNLKDKIAAATKKNWPATMLKPESKSISLSSDHHGNNKLKDFAKHSLRPLDYIIEVSTSLEYDKRSSHFVKAIYTDTKQIDIVLYWENAGYSMRVKTTATDDMQLRQQAQDLEKRFGEANFAYKTFKTPTV